MEGTHWSYIIRKFHSYNWIHLLYLDNKCVLTWNEGGSMECHGTRSFYKTASAVYPLKNDPCLWKGVFFFWCAGNCCGCSLFCLCAETASHTFPVATPMSADEYHNDDWPSNKNSGVHIYLVIGERTVRFWDILVPHNQNV